MEDLLRKTALLSILLVALLIVIVVQLCQLLRHCRARPRKKQTKKDCGGRRARKGMGDDNLHGGHMYGMGSAPTNGVPNGMCNRFDPALYAHLPSYMQPLPDEEDWVPPPSTLPLARGSTQTSYETGGRSGDRGTGMGPMSTLLTGGGGAGADPLQLHLSPSCSMDASRTVLVEHSSRSQGGVLVTMQDARENGPQTQRPARSSSACTSSHSRPPGFRTPLGTGVPHAVVNGRVTTATAAESPQVIERIIALYSRMCSDVERDDGGDTCADGEDVAEAMLHGGRGRRPAAGTPLTTAGPAKNFRPMPLRIREGGWGAGNGSRVLLTRVGDSWSQRGSTSAPCWIAVQMEVDVALRGRVLGRFVIFYEMRHRRGQDYSRDFGFENGVFRHEVHHYEIDADEDTCLHLTLDFGFGRSLLRQVVVFARKVGTAIPNPWP
ncbi:hypothetical protein CBR_g37417 [Chara braunii]|uniref:Uncharacterized protein n=1 Tax=Chara braunii TaxID=69332 RepID=A0A388LN13_CHABU|nr:hypothetical protein CBR_g37417 [Chara braunii]|eukprot:GBG83613.1 hypothetical protein CBR_g37417 [Chara braunii]